MFTLINLSCFTFLLLTFCLFSRLLLCFPVGLLTSGVANRSGFSSFPCFRICFLHCGPAFAACLSFVGSFFFYCDTGLQHECCLPHLLLLPVIAILNRHHLLIHLSAASIQRRYERTSWSAVDVSPHCTSNKNRRRRNGRERGATRRAASMMRRAWPNRNCDNAMRTMVEMTCNGASDGDE